MATYDLMNFSITRNGSVSVSIPRFTITCDVINSKTQAVIKQINTNFPAFLSQFSEEEKEDALKKMITELIQLKATQ